MLERQDLPVYSSVRLSEISDSRVCKYLFVGVAEHEVHTHVAQKALCIDLGDRIPWNGKIGGNTHLDDEASIT